MLWKAGRNASLNLESQDGNLSLFSRSVAPENDDEEITEKVVEHSSEEKADTTAGVAGKVLICSGSVKDVKKAGKEFL